MNPQPTSGQGKSSFGRGWFSLLCFLRCLLRVDLKLHWRQEYSNGKVGAFLGLPRFPAGLISCDIFVAFSKVFTLFGLGGTIFLSIGDKGRARNFVGLPRDSGGPTLDNGFSTYSFPFGHGATVFCSVGSSVLGATTPVCWVGWFKNRFEISRKLSNWSRLTLVLPRYMNLFRSCNSKVLTPWRYIRGWGFGFCLKILENSVLQELKTTLCAWRALPSPSQARVTSVKSTSSKSEWKAVWLVPL